MTVYPLHDYPPYAYFEFILLHCPQAAWTYFKLWSKRDKDSKIRIKKSDIRYEFLKSQTKFKNELLDIAKEALVNVDETPEEMIIEMVSWDEPDQNSTICG
jgi:hypothetical protein